MTPHLPGRTAAILLAAAVAAARAAAAPPVAPVPEPLVEAAVADPAVGRVAFTSEAGAGNAVSTAGAVPLDRPGRESRPGPRPLPDWRLLAALGGAFAVLAGHRLLASRRVPSLPPDVFEVLGTASLGGQQSVRIVRFGPRTLLLGVSSAGWQTLAELADPQSTEAIVAACRSGPAVGPERRSPRRREARA